MNFLEISQKIKEDPAFKNSTENSKNDDRPPVDNEESHISSHKDMDIFQRLYTEEIRKFNPKCGSPLARHEIIEQQNLKECIFKPSIGDVSQDLAEKHKSRSRQLEISDALADDAKKRYFYKLQLEEEVWFSGF